MRRSLPPLLLGSALLLDAVAHAAGVATPENAKAMATKAAEYLKSAGPEKAFPEFSDKDGPWHDRDLYVTVETDQGATVANGTNAGMIGKLTLDLKDPDGKPFIRDMIAVKDTGWIHYRWMNPLSKAIEPKSAFIVRVGEYTVGVGAYDK